MGGAESTGGAQTNPLAAERERLRKEGYTEAEISQILIARATVQQTPAAGGAGSLGTGAMSGTLANVGAALAYGRSFLPTLRGDLVKMFDSALSPVRRVEATLFLALKIVVIAAIAYAVKQEWQQHINSAPALAGLQVEKTRSDLCIARADAMAKEANDSNIRALSAQFNKDCVVPNLPTPAVEVISKPLTNAKYDWDTVAVAAMKAGEILLDCKAEFVATKSTAYFSIHVDDSGLGEHSFGETTIYNGKGDTYFRKTDDEIRWGTKTSAYSFNWVLVRKTGAVTLDIGDSLYEEGTCSKGNGWR